MQQHPGYTDKHASISHTYRRVGGQDHCAALHMYKCTCYMYVCRVLLLTGEKVLVEYPYCCVLEEMHVLAVSCVASVKIHIIIILDLFA